MLKRKGREEKKNKILMLIDFENLRISAGEGVLPDKFSIESGFNRVIKAITKEIGEIVGVFVFLPSDRASIWGRDLDEMGFNIIQCPKRKIKNGTEQDSTDSRLLDLGEWLVNNVKNITHICIGSGDRDFNELRKKVALKGLERITVAANLSSLSSEVIKLTDTNPSTGKKMVYLFSPSEE